VAALFVLTTGMFGALGLYMTVISTMRTEAVNAAARAAVQNEIEAVRALPFSRAAAPGDRPFVTDPAAQGLDPARGTVTARSWPGTGGLAEVRVRLEYDNGRRAAVVEETTLVAEAVP
jgi:hypothetical protein